MTGKWIDESCVIMDMNAAERSQPMYFVCWRSDENDVSFAAWSPNPHYARAYQEREENELEETLANLRRRGLRVTTTCERMTWR